MISIIAINLILALTALAPPYPQEEQLEQDLLDYTLADIEFEGKTIFDLKRLVSRFGMKRGDPYDPKRIKEKIDDIQRLFFNLGYIDFTYIPRININSTEKTVFCIFLLIPGKQYFVKQITIYGSEKTYDKEIRSELSVMFMEEGKIFNLPGLKLAILRVERFLETRPKTSANN